MFSTTGNRRSLKTLEFQRREVTVHTPVNKVGFKKPQCARQPRVRPSLAVHLVVNPLATVLPPVLPTEGPAAFHVVPAKLSIVDGPVGPLEAASAVLLTTAVDPNVPGGVVPLLDSLTVLQIVKPLANILRLLGRIGTVAVGLVHLPLPVILVTLRVDESSPSDGDTLQ